MIAATELRWTAHARRRARERLGAVPDAELHRTHLMTKDGLHVYAAPTFAVLVLERCGRVAPLELEAVTVITREMALLGTKRCPAFDPAEHVRPVLDDETVLAALQEHHRPDEIAFALGAREAEARRKLVDMQRRGLVEREKTRRGVCWRARRDG